MTKRPFITAWIALCFGFGLTACASSMANTQPEDARGLIDLNARMPVGQSPYGIAYGTPSPGRVQPLTPEIDEFLKPEAREATKQTLVATRVTPAKKVASVVKAAPEPVAFEPVINLEPNQEQLLALATELPPPSSDDSSRYAEREAQNQNLEKFRGVDAIVITSGALIVILLVVILVLLLT
jgi:hypothetical protein